MPTVDPADIRGLGTTLLRSVERLPYARHEGRPQPPRNAPEGGAPPGPRLWPSRGLRAGRHAGSGTSLAMAPRNASTSRVMAVHTTLACFPRARSRGLWVGDVGYLLYLSMTFPHCPTLGGLKPSPSGDSFSIGCDKMPAWGTGMGHLARVYRVTERVCRASIAP